MKSGMIDLPYRDRRQAGLVLAADLEQLRGEPDLLVLGLPRGGVPVAYEVARRLGAALDVMVVRKLGTPGHEELAMGAIASGGVCERNEDVIAAAAIPPSAVAAAIARERQELERRERAYRGGRPPLELAGKLVLLVDDGLATGATMCAAIAAARRGGARRLLVAAPVGAKDTVARLRLLADAIVCPAQPAPFAAIGAWYANFEQTSDGEVRELLRAAAGARAVARSH